MAVTPGTLTIDRAILGSRVVLACFINNAVMEALAFSAIIAATIRAQALVSCFFAGIIFILLFNDGCYYDITTAVNNHFDGSAADIVDGFTHDIGYFADHFNNYFDFDVYNFTKIGYLTGNNAFCEVLCLKLNSHKLGQPGTLSRQGRYSAFHS